MTAFYLGFSDEATGCAICNEEVPAGLAGFCDDNPPHPVCYACLGKRGAHDRDRLQQAPHTHILESAALVPEALASLPPAG